VPRKVAKHQSHSQTNVLFIYMSYILHRRHLMLSSLSATELKVGYY